MRHGNITESSSYSQAWLPQVSSGNLCSPAVRSCHCVQDCSVEEAEQNLLPFPPPTQEDALSWSICTHPCFKHPRLSHLLGEDVPTDCSDGGPCEFPLCTMEGCHQSHGSGWQRVLLLIHVRETGCDIGCDLPPWEPAVCTEGGERVAH